MEKNTYTINIDYEFELYDINYKDRRNNYRHYNEEFEHLFLWLESDELNFIPSRAYCPDYLSFIKSVTGAIPRLLDNDNRIGDLIPWWGKTEPFDLAKKLNSKLLSTELALEYGLCHSLTRIIDKNFDFSTLDFGPYQKYILKKANSFSGLGNRTLSPQKRIVIDESCILEPFLSIEKEFGLTVDGSKRDLIKTLQNEKGHFCGGMTGTFPEYEEITDKLEPIIRYYQEFDELGSFEIDSFYYREDSILKLYPLVEVNYRKTMSYFINNLRCLLNPHGEGVWLLYKNKKQYSSYDNVLDELKKVIYNRHSKSGIIPISPVDGHYLSFYFIANDMSELNALEARFKKIFRGN